MPSFSLNPAHISYYTHTPLQDSNIAWIQLTVLDSLLRNADYKEDQLGMKPLFPQQICWSFVYVAKSYE